MSIASLIDSAATSRAERSRRFAWQVTLHAAEQYRDRVDKTMTVTAAWRLLERCLPAAELLPQPTNRGQARWLLPGGDAVVVCKPDPKIRARVAVTVLGPHEMCEPEAAAEVVEAFDRTRTKAPPAPLPQPKPLAIAKVPAPAKKREMVSRAQLEDVERNLVATKDHVVRLQAVLAQTTEQHAEQRKADRADRRAHALVMDQELTRTKNLLRVAVIALRDGDCARGLRLLEGAEPGITGDHFCYPERLTRQERRAATMAAREATGGVS